MGTFSEDGERAVQDSGESHSDVAECPSSASPTQTAVEDGGAGQQTNGKTAVRGASSDGQTRQSLSANGSVESDHRATTAAPHRGDVPTGTESVESRATHVGMVSTPDDGSCGIGTYTGDLAESFSESRIETIELDQQAQSVSHFLGLAVRVARADLDVVHVQHEYGLFRQDDSRWPGVLTLHSVLRPEQSESSLRIRTHFTLMHWLFAAVSDHLVFLSDRCANRFLRDVPLSEQRYTTLPHGVNVRDAESMPQTDAKQRFGYEPDDTVIMIPGYIRPPKGHDVFVELAAELPDYEFLIAGGARSGGQDGEYARTVNSEAPENVTVTGVLELDRFNAAFNATDLAVLPYREVSQSGTFNWCGAHALPVLASEQPYFQTLKNEWQILETADATDVETLASEAESLLESPDTLAELHENMRRYRRENSFEKVAQSHQKIYDSILDTEPASGTARRTASNGLTATD